MATANPTIEIDVYSDLACPWCYVGQRNLDEALSNLGDNPATVNVSWRAFLLDPTYHAKNPMGEPLDEALVAKFGKERSEAMKARLKESGAKVGATFTSWNFRPNTLPGHRLVALARQQEGQDMSHEANRVLFRRSFEQGENISDPKVLIEAGKELNLPNVEEWVQGDDGVMEVLQDVDVARSQLRVSGVPAFFIRGQVGTKGSKTYALSGAQPPEVFQEVFEQVIDEAGKA